MDKIKQYFETITDLPEEDWEKFNSMLVKQEYPKKTVLLEAEKTENYLSFIEKGLIRMYVPGDTGDTTFAFAFENAFVSGYESFLSRKPSAYRVETLTPTILWRITYNDLQLIYRETSAGNIIGRHASEGLFLESSRRELSLLTQTAEQRYLNLLQEQPNLIRDIPLKYLASYIGITPQALSRIRSRIS